MRTSSLTVQTYRLEVREPGRAAATLGKTQGTKAHAMEVAFDRYEALAYKQGDRPLPMSQVYITVTPLCGTCKKNPTMAGWDICDKCDGSRGSVAHEMAILDALDNQSKRGR